MKKNLLTLITVLVAIVMGTGMSNAHNFEVDGIYYNIIDETSVEVTYCDENKDGQVDDDEKYVGKVVIPATVKYNNESYSVKGIFGYAFFNNTKLTSLILPEGVIYIGSNAFSNTAIDWNRL